MPFPLPSRAAPGPRRRTLFASAAGAVLLAGCSGDPDGSASGNRGASAEDRARARAARDSERLLERYDAVSAAHPGLAGRLRPLRAEVVRHARAFGGGDPASASSSASASAPSSATASAAGSTLPPPSGSPSATASARDTVPADPAAALAGLAAAERKLADRRIAALAGLPGETARLLASVAAAGAAHAYLLTKSEPKPGAGSDAGSGSGTEEKR